MKKYKFLALFVLLAVVGTFLFLKSRNLTEVKEEWKFVSETDLFTVSFSTTNDSAKTKLEKDGHTYVFTEPIDNPTLEQRDGQYIFSDAKTQLIYHVTEEGLKEDIVLLEKPTSNEFKVTVEAPNMDMRFNEEDQPVFTSKDGEYQFQLQAPWAKDAAGEMNESISYRLDSQEGDNFYLSLVLDEEWLNDEERVYPITIDPVVFFRGLRFGGIKVMRPTPVWYLPDTGQTLCYTMSGTAPCGSIDFPNQDADYTIHAPSYSTLSSVTVTDNVTGLEWQRHGHGSSNGYTVPTAVGNCGVGGSYASSYCMYDWQEALQYCSNLTLDGKTDWRLPNVLELVSIVRYGIYGSINSTYFLYNYSNYPANYWSSSTYSNINASYVNFYSGPTTGSQTKTNSYKIRCARGQDTSVLGIPDTGITSCYNMTTSTQCGTSLFPDQDGDYTIHAPSYSTLSSVTVIDNVTELEWQRHGHGSSDGTTPPTAVGNCAVGGTFVSGTPNTCTYNWQYALQYCSDLTLDSKTDWRLPNAKELVSIVDSGKFSPATNTTYFLNTYDSNYWSSSTYFANNIRAYPVSFFTGYSTYDDKTDTYSARCVRGGT